ncbi:MAG: nucleotidyltransferase domain-containing protein [Janthinobacterium lividum]
MSKTVGDSLYAVSSAILPFRELSNEMQAMLLAARPQDDPDQQAQLAELCGRHGFNWERLVHLALHHSLGSLVHAGLGRCCPMVVPTKMRALLQQQSMTNAFRAFRWMREVARLSDAFAKAGYLVAVLKGVPLSEQLYGSAHARHVGDIDLLIAPQSIPSTVLAQIELFRSLGYTRINPAVELTPRRMHSYARFWKDITFQNTKDDFDLDLHWRLFNHRMHPANRLLKDARFFPQTSLGCTVLTLPPEDQFLHVAAHGVSDAWIYLKSLADVAGFLALLTPAQLESALRRAQDLGLLKQVSAAIHLSNEWMGSRATSRMLLPQTEPLAQELHSSVSHLLRNYHFTPTRDDRAPAAWVRLERAIVPGVRPLLENFSRLLWRPRVWKRFNLPDRLFWLYPFLALILLPRAESLWRRIPAVRAGAAKQSDL